ncbi:MAG: methyltransferase domain-containing protein [Bacillota bacterium]|nr:methyltransferase domain-containing protein [Bacillota bacterium]
MITLEFLYDKVDFDDNMVCYYDELPLWSSPFGILLLNNIPLIKNSVVVDIGCGTGFPLLELAQRLGESCKVFGIDPWETAIDRANRKREQYRIKNVELLKGVGENMPFSNENIDIVISNLGINNFENPDEVITECFRVLKSRGKLIFTTNLFGHFDEFYSIFEGVLCDLKLENEINNLNKHIKKRHSLEDISTLMKRNRFSTKKIIQENYVMRFVDGSSFFNHYFIKLAFLQEWKEIIKEDNWNNVFLNLENRLNNIASEKGEIVFNVPMAYIECEK